MARRGVCVGCKREMSIHSRGMCGSCARKALIAENRPDNGANQSPAQFVSSIDETLPNVASGTMDSGEKRYITSIMSVIVRPAGDEIYSDMATTVAITTEGDGEFVTVSQPRGREGEISLTSEEWPHVKAAIEKMLVLCQ